MLTFEVEKKSVQPEWQLLEILCSLSPFVLSVNGQLLCVRTVLW